MQRATCRSVIVHSGRENLLSERQISALLRAIDKGWQDCDEDVAEGRDRDTNVENLQGFDETNGNGQVLSWRCEAERRAQLYQGD